MGITAALLTLGTGLVLFLLGLDRLGESLQRLAGDRLRGALARLTSNKLLGLSTGVGVTALAQSSSVTTVLLVGLTSAGLIQVAQTVPVILGADIGSTITAQLIAFKATSLGQPLVILGFVSAFIARSASAKQRGELLLGLGLVFYGMELMSVATAPLRHDAHISAWLSRLDHPALGVLAGTVLTAIIQSSAATTGMVMALAGDGLISLEGAIAITLGANIGTCATAALAAVGKSRSAVQVAVVHVMAKLIGVAVWLWLIPQLAALARWVTPDDVEAPLAALPRQIANAHTLFNCAIAAALLPCSGLLARLAQALVGEHHAAANQVAPRHLEASLLATPELAITALRYELVHLGERVEAQLTRALPLVWQGDAHAVERLQRDDDAIDRLHEACLRWGRQLTSAQLSPQQAGRLAAWLEIAGELEALGDVVEQGLSACADGRAKLMLHASAETRARIEQYQAEVLLSLRQALHALRERDRRAAQLVQERKAGLKELQDALLAHLAKRLAQGDDSRLPVYRWERDIVEHLHRVATGAKRIARAVVNS